MGVALNKFQIEEIRSRVWCEVVVDLTLDLLLALLFIGTFVECIYRAWACTIVPATRRHTDAVTEDAWCRIICKPLVRYSSGIWDTVHRGRCQASGATAIFIYTMYGKENLIECSKFWAEHLSGQSDVFEDKKVIHLCNYRQTNLCATKKLFARTIVHSKAYDHSLHSRHTVVCCLYRDYSLKVRAGHGSCGAFPTISWQSQSVAVEQGRRATRRWKAKASIKIWIRTIGRLCGLAQTVFGYAHRISVCMRRTSMLDKHGKTWYWADARKHWCESLRILPGGAKSPIVLKWRNQQNLVDRTSPNRMGCSDIICMNRTDSYTFIYIQKSERC